MFKVMSNGTVESNFQSTNLLKERKNHKFKSIWISTKVQVKHIAASLPHDILTTNDLRSRGIEFLSTPTAYYDAVPFRLGSTQSSLKEDIDKLMGLGIDADGYLLQIFTKPIEDRPNLFIFSKLFKEWEPEVQG
jgi:4-hydroxyphenylpyruvate dioxygenase